VGIGDNKLRAKIATGFAKPAGVYRLTKENWVPVMGERPTAALWGIGPRTSAKLTDLGLVTVADLARAEPLFRWPHDSGHGWARGTGNSRWAQATLR